MKKSNVSIAIFFVAMAFVLTMSILMSIFFGVNRYVLEKKSHIPMYVFCSASINKTGVDKVASSLGQKKGVLNVKVIYKNEAFKDMVNKFSIDKTLFDKNPFPNSIELFFEPSYTNMRYFKQFASEIKADRNISRVLFPEKILTNIENVKNRVMMLSEIILSTLYAVEFIVFISVITVLYSHKRYDFNTLKFFGVKRIKIFFLFLKDTFYPVLSASFLSILFVALFYVLYDKYGNIYYINKELLTNSLKMTFIVNVSVGLIFTLFSSIFVFLVNDEKV